MRKGGAEGGGGENLTLVVEGFSLYGRGGENRNFNKEQECCRRHSERQRRSWHEHTLWIKSNCLQRVFTVFKAIQTFACEKFISFNLQFNNIHPKTEIFLEQLNLRAGVQG